MESCTATRRFGDAEVSLISDGSGRSVIVKSLEVPEAEWRAAVPEADAEGEITVGYNVALVRTGGAVVLIDLGFDEPGPESPWKEPRHQRSPGVEAGLRELGVAPEDVTHVLITHAHGDHVAGAVVNGRPRFPRARHFINRLDWDAERLAAHMGAVEAAGLVELVDSDRAAMEASRRRLMAEAVPANATLVFSHRPWPAWGRIVAVGDGYRWVDDGI